MKVVCVPLWALFFFRFPLLSKPMLGGDGWFLAVTGCSRFPHLLENRIICTQALPYVYGTEIVTGFYMIHVMIPGTNIIFI